MPGERCKSQQFRGPVPDTRRVLHRTQLSRDGVTQVLTETPSFSYSMQNLVLERAVLVSRIIRHLELYSSDIGYFFARSHENQLMSKRLSKFNSITASPDQQGNPPSFRASARGASYFRPRQCQRGLGQALSWSHIQGRYFETISLCHGCG